MDKVVSLLKINNFKRVFISNSRSVVVVHAVPGAGKTFLIKQILREVAGAICVSLGPPVLANSESLPFFGASDTLPEHSFLIIDEYQLGYSDSLSPKLLIGDPCQSPRPCLRPNFLKETTERFGEKTCIFLQSLGFSIVSHKEDSFTIKGIFEADLVGQVLCFEEEVQALLVRHNCPYETPETIQGRTFKECTVIFAHTTLLPCFRHLAFVCLTRHTSSLLLLTPDGTYTSS